MTLKADNKGFAGNKMLFVIGLVHIQATTERMTNPVTFTAWWKVFPNGDVRTK